MVKARLASLAFPRTLGWLVSILGVLAVPILTLAQDPQTLPPAQSVPRDSVVDVSTLPPPERARDAEPVKVKPFRVPDPQALRDQKDLLQQVPGALPPAPGVIEDVTHR